MPCVLSVDNECVKINILNFLCMYLTANVRYRTIGVRYRTVGLMCSLFNAY